MRAHLGHLLLIPLAVAALLWAALWSGFPLMFPDVGIYVLASFTGQFLEDKAPLYPKVLAFTHFKTTLWFTVLAQAVFLYAAIWAALEAVGLRLAGWRLPLLVCSLAVLTPLGIASSFVLPDTFTACVPLLFLALIFDPDSPKIRREVRLLLLGLGWAVALCVNHAHLPLGIALTLMAFSHAKIFPRGTFGAARFVPAVLVIGLSWAYISWHNFRAVGRPVVARGFHAFYMNRLIEEGVIQRFLREECPTTHYRLCDLQSDLESNSRDYRYFFSPSSPLWKLGGYDRAAEFNLPVLIDSFFKHPGWHFSGAAMQFWRQFLNFDVTRLARSLSPDEPPIPQLRTWLPGDLGRVQKSRQQTTPGLVFGSSFLYKAVFWLSWVAGLLLWFRFPRMFNPTRPRSNEGALLEVALATVRLNAAICGIFSHAASRYQGRIVWLVPLAVGATILARHRHGADRP